MNLYKSAPAFLAAVALLLISCSKKEDPAAQLPPPPAKADTTATADPELKPIQAVSNKLNSSNTPDQLSNAATPTGKGSYVIQVDIKPSQNAADKVIEKLGANAIQAYVAEVENPGELEGTYYRVRIGFFGSIAEATNYAKATLAPLGYAWWVDHKKNDAVGNPSAAATVNQAPSVPATDWQQSAPDPTPDPTPTPQVEAPAPQPTPPTETLVPTPATQPSAPAAAPATAPTKDEWQ